jgi:hypothetical protein
MNPLRRAAVRAWLGGCKSRVSMQRSGIGLGVGLLGVLVAWGCAGAKGDGPGLVDVGVDAGAGESDGIGDTEFVSSTGPDGLVFSAAGESLGAVAGPTAPIIAAGGDPRTALAEADIVELSGERLYALSRYRGLSIIDVSNPSAPSLLGEYRAEARPARLFVEDGIVYAMFSSWRTYRCEDDAQTCGWASTDRIQALDTRDPASIQVLADIELPGSITDSSRLGDVLYLTTHERDAGTTLTSFDLSDAGPLTQLAQLHLPVPQGRRVFAPRVHATDQRLYVAGLEYDIAGEAYVPSSVQVVDISGGPGALALGGRVEVAGAVTHTWQMDEYDGVLRVITPKGSWGDNGQPVIETFRVSSSSDVQPLGSLEVALQYPDAPLNGARFDGPRAFSFIEDIDAALFTFDLSDPANPRQVGQLGVPSQVHRVELRDGRLFVLGSNLYSSDGMLNLSLYDVEDLAAPQLVGRVAFGDGFTGASNVETQMARTFSILADQNLILVPFGGNDFFEPCGGTIGSGIQLIDFTDTTLTRRGVAPQVGLTQRALLHEGHLLGVGDNSVQVFDITNRDGPTARGRFELVRSASALRAIDDHIVRFGTDWSTGRSTLDSTWLERAGDATPEAQLDLAALAAASCSDDSIWTGQIFMQGNFAYLPHRQGESAQAAGLLQLTLHVLDLTDRAAPRFAGQVRLEAAAGESFASVLQTDGALLVGRRGPGGPSYDIIDLADPSAPVLASRFEVPAALASQGWASLPTRLSCTRDRACNAELTDGDIVMSQHAEPIAGSPTQVKYYLDRVDVSDPYAPRLLPSINVPGIVIHFDAETGALVTRDLQERTVPAQSSDDCYGLGVASPSGDSCRVFATQLDTLAIEGDRAVRRSRLELDYNRWLRTMAVSDSRVFYVTVERETPMAERVYPDFFSEVTSVLLESVAFESGRLVQLPARELRRVPRNTFSYNGELYARGERAFELFGNQATVIDPLDSDTPRLVSRALADGGCQSLEISGEKAYCAQGEAGVEVIELSSTR